MAELVQLRLEFTLQELHGMEETGLFNRKEIKLIIKRRQEFEYRLRSGFKSKEDYLKYIEYEMNLLELVKKRRERLLCDENKENIDYSMAKRVKALFRMVQAHFPEDEKLFLDEIAFTKKVFRGKMDYVTDLYTKVLQVHSKNPDLWVMAAKNVLEEGNDTQSARVIFQRGVLINPHSETLWREYYRMELMYIDLITKRREVLEPPNLKKQKVEEHEDVVLTGAVANIVFDEALKEITGVEFALSFIQIALNFEFGKKHVDYILNIISEKYPDCEETLDAIAKRPLLDITERIKEGKDQGIRKKIIISNVNEEIAEKYEEAVGKLPTEKMWGLYIDFMLNSYASKNMKMPKKIIDIMERAASADLLATPYYSHWIDLLLEQGEEEKALSFALESARRKKSCVDLWHKCLTCYIEHSTQPEEQTYQLLLEAIGSVEAKQSGMLWKLGVSWFTLNNPELLVDFLERGIKEFSEFSEFSEPLKQMYLETTYINNGIQATRDLYERLKKKDFRPSLINTMVELEKGELNASLDTMRKYYEQGIQRFGKCNVDIWVDLMKLETTHKDGKPNAVSELYWRAKKTLDGIYLKELQARAFELSTNSIIPQEVLEDQ